MYLCCVHEDNLHFSLVCSHQLTKVKRRKCSGGKSVRTILDLILSEEESKQGYKVRKEDFQEDIKRKSRFVVLQHLA